MAPNDKTVETVEMKGEEKMEEVVIVDDAENTNNNNGNAAAAGGCAACACCLICLSFFVGIPLFIAGAVFLSPLVSWISWAMGAGIACIILGILMIIGAIVACVMTGVCASKSKGTAPAPQVVVVQDGTQVQPVQQEVP